MNCRRQVSLSITNSWSLLKLMSIESVMPSNHLILCRSLLLLPSIFPSIRVFSNESALCTRWPKYWPSIQHQSFQWIFRTDFLQDSLVWSTCSPRDSQESSPTPQFKSMISSALSFIYCPTFISIHDHWKNHSFDWTFVGKVMFLIFNMLSRFVIVFLPKSKHLLISWLQSPSAVILESKKIKSVTVPIYFPWSDGTIYHDPSFLNVEL